MKNKYISTLLIALVIVIGFTLFSCATVQDKIQATHESIIGTIWFSATSSKDTVTFLDSENCIVTMGNSITGRIGIAEVPYKVDDTKIIIGNGIIWFELRKGTLYAWGRSPFNKQ
jgi:hypothetical protein